MSNRTPARTLRLASMAVRAAMQMQTARDYRPGPLAAPHGAENERLALVLALAEAEAKLAHLEGDDG